MGNIKALHLKINIPLKISLNFCPLPVYKDSPVYFGSKSTDLKCLLKRLITSIYIFMK